jgi:ATP-dependent RNA helicase DDX19/DBP5
VERYDADATKNGVVENLWEALNEVDVRLADKQADINSPLYSAKTFEELGLYHIY